MSKTKVAWNKLPDNTPPSGFFFPMNHIVKAVGIATATVLFIGLYFWAIPWLFSQNSLLSIAIALILALTPVAAVAAFIFSQITKE